MLAHGFDPLTAGTWLERRQRFLLDVRLSDGTLTTAHCPNTGAMTGVSQPGMPVLMSRSGNPKRRYALTLEAVGADGVWVGVNTQNPNRVALALARTGAAPFAACASVRPEVRYGRAERIDLLTTASCGTRTYVEVKNVHLRAPSGEAEFPDCVTVRGAKHLDAMAEVVRAGDEAMTLYLVQRDDVTAFRLARHIDPGYAAAFDRAVLAGVAMVALRCRIDRRGISVLGELPILDLPPAARGDAFGSRAAAPGRRLRA